MCLPTFDLCGSDSDSEGEMFLMQVVKSESQQLLNQTMTMDDNFDVNLFVSPSKPEETTTSKSVIPEKFFSELSDMYFFLQFNGHNLSRSFFHCSRHLFLWNDQCFQ